MESKEPNDSTNRIIAPFLNLALFCETGKYTFDPFNPFFSRPI
jgi:hypothetical protein